MAGTLTIRVNEKTKNDAKAILSDLGLDLSTAINIYLKQIVKKGGIPFMIEAEPSQQLKKALDEINDYQNLKAYKDADEMFDDLDLESK